jgi:predicted ATPase
MSAQPTSPPAAFVEEMTKAVLESGLPQAPNGLDPMSELAAAEMIPTTLQDSLMSRLDKLGTAKRMAQLGATIGRQFSYELLQAIAPVDEATLHTELGRLVEAELLYQRGQGREATYTFKHALIQDAAYQSLLKRHRQQVHQHIAQALEARFPEATAAQPELLAHHLTEAGLHAQAVGFWQLAGEKAFQRSAHAEAIVHHQKGLELLKILPDTPDRTLQEVILQRNLGVSLLATKGLAAPEVEVVYGRARELCQRVGDASHIFPPLCRAGSWRHSTEIRPALRRYGLASMPTKTPVHGRLKPIFCRFWRKRMAALETPSRG